MERSQGQEYALVESMKKQLCIPLSKWRPYLAGQRAPHAAPRAETRGSSRPPLPRSAPHLCHACTAKRRGYQNRLRYAGALLRRLHARHLCPRHHCRTKGSSKHDGECAADSLMQIQGRVKSLCVFNPNCQSSRELQKALTVPTGATVSSMRKMVRITGGSLQNPVDSLFHKLYYIVVVIKHG